jgi:acyl carrier protein
VQGDVAREEDVARALAGAGPGLHGIVHAAGVLNDGPLAAQSWERARSVLAPKILGGFHLDRLTRSGAPALQHFVVFSSLTSVIGSPQQLAYAASNACLDALMRARAAAGLPGQSINWTAWAEVGLAAPGESRLRAFGISPLSVEEGSAVLRKILQSGATEVAVLAIDWERYAESLGLRLPLLAELVDLSIDAPVRATAAVAPRLDELDVERLRAGDPSAREAMLRTWLTNAIAAGLQCRPAELDPERPLNAMGMDSLVGMELRTAIETRLGISVPMVALLDGPSITSLGRLLAQELDAARSEVVVSVPPAPR